jgi:diguanylate cyclase (GGDEF)-like protein
MLRRPSVRLIAVTALVSVVLLTAGLAYVAFHAGNQRQTANDRVEVKTEVIQLYQDARTAALAETTAAVTYAILQEPDALARFEDAQGDVDEALAALRDSAALHDPSDLQDEIALYTNSHTDLVGSYQRVFEAMGRGDQEAAVAIAEQQGIEPLATTFLANLALAAREAGDELLDAQQASRAAESASDRAIFSIIGMWSVVILFGSFVLVRWVVRPIERIGAATRSIAAGDLTIRAPEDGPNELARLGSDVNQMAGVLIERSEQLEGALKDEQERACQDSLTSALNHAAIVDELRARIATCREAESFSIAMADVDGLKAVNDTYGHQMGDAVLVAIAKVLSDNGAIAGRYGGDEFLVILPGRDRDAAERYRDDVRRALARTLLKDAEGVRVPVVASIGLAVYPSEAERIDELIRLADSAMYTAKRQTIAAANRATERVVSGERAARLVSDIVPLLTAPGGREDKLRLVAHHLSVGAGYDAVNFETVGAPAEEHPAWERAFVRAPEHMIDAWISQMQEGETGSEHPLVQTLERTRRPLFVDSIAEDEHLTEEERGLLLAGGLRSGLSVPMIWHDRLVGILSVASKEDAAFTSWDAHFLTAIASQVTAIVYMTTLVEELKAASESLAQAHGETVMMLAAAAEAHDDTTGRHLRRVRAITEALSRELGYNEEQAYELGLASVLHDIGKIRVPDTVLTSPGKLAEDEWALMKQHTLWGAEFLSGRPGFDLAQVMARSHHERWDGGGYPDGLAGEEIPEAALIISVSDSFDAITSDRPYRAGRPASEAVEEIVSCSGAQFSPRVVEGLVRLYKRGALPLVDTSQAQRAAA